MSAGWMGEARRRLLTLRGAGGSWGYTVSGTPAVEPTALAGLALLDAEPNAAADAAGSLAAAARPDGSLGPTATLPGAAWPTALASIVWAAAGGHRPRRDAAARWLLASRSLAAPPARDGVLGHDTSLAGWPWVEQTTPWVEPTALALLALGARPEPRVAQGLAMLRDRAIPSGGWNMGNPTVFGTPLRPQPGPTGLALLALTAAGGAAEPAAAPAIAYLIATLPTTRAAASLAWGLLGLRARGVEPHDAPAWLAEAARLALGSPRALTALALLLLAADPGSPGRLGVRPRAEIPS